MEKNDSMKNFPSDPHPKLPPLATLECLALGRKVVTLRSLACTQGVGDPMILFIGGQ
jgi:hypothetical protein